MSQVSSIGGGSSYRDEALLGVANVVQNRGNSNNNNSIEEIQASKSDKKRSLAVACHRGNIEVTLEGKTLWDEFYRRGTEMIVNRAGR